MHPSEHQADAAHRRSLGMLDEDEPFNWEDPDHLRDIEKDDA